VQEVEFRLEQSFRREEDNRRRKEELKSLGVKIVEEMQKKETPYMRAVREWEERTGERAGLLNPKFLEFIKNYEAQVIGAPRRKLHVIPPDEPIAETPEPKAPSARAEEYASKGPGEADRQRGLQMRGHLRERSPGHWAIVIDARDPQTSQRKRRWHSFAGTKRQAQVEAARLISELQNGTHIDPSRMTVAAFLERWIEHMQGQVSPRSHERYAELCRKNLAPLGGLALTKLQPAHITPPTPQRSPAAAGMALGAFPRVR